MLNSASDYKFVNTTNVASLITGDILPVMHPTANEFAQVRFEDYLFILEGYYERQNWDQAGLNNISPATLPLLKSTIRGVEYFLPGTAVPASGIWSGTGDYNIPAATISGVGSAFWISPNATVPAYVLNSNNTNIQQILSNISLRNPTRFSPYYDMLPPTTAGWMWQLFGEYIRARYWTLDHMSKLLLGVNNSVLATSAQTVYYNTSGGVDRTVDSITASGMEIERYIPYGSTTPALVKDTEITYKSSMSVPYASAAKLIASVYYADLDSNYSGYHWISKSLTVANGAIVIPARLYEQMIEDVCTLIGHTYARARQLRLTNPFLIIDFEFPARLNGVSWNWSP